MKNLELVKKMISGEEAKRRIVAIKLIEEFTEEFTEAVKNMNLTYINDNEITVSEYLVLTFVTKEEKNSINWISTNKGKWYDKTVGFWLNRDTNIKDLKGKDFWNAMIEATDWMTNIEAKSAA